MHVKLFTYVFSLFTSISTSVLGYNTRMNTPVKEATVHGTVTAELSLRQPIEFAPFVMIWIQRNRGKDVSGPQSASLFFVHPWVWIESPTGKNELVDATAGVRPRPR